MCPHGPQPPYPKDEDIHVVTKDVMADPSSPPPELRVVTVRHIQFHLSPIVADEIERLRKQTEVQPLLLEDAYAKWIRKTVPSDNHFTTFRAGFEAAQGGGIMWNCPCGASNDHDSVVCHACCRNRPAAEPSRDPAKRCQHDLLKPRSTVVVAAHGKSAICGVCLESWAIGAIEPGAPQLSEPFTVSEHQVTRITTAYESGYGRGESNRDLSQPYRAGCAEALAYYQGWLRGCLCNAENRTGDA